MSDIVEKMRRTLIKDKISELIDEYQDLKVIQVLYVIMRKGNFKNKQLDLYEQTDVELNEALTKLLNEIKQEKQ
jgi:hypothetical protein